MSWYRERATSSGGGGGTTIDLTNLVADTVTACNWLYSKEYRNLPLASPVTSGIAKLSIDVDDTSKALASTPYVVHQAKTAADFSSNAVVSNSNSLFPMAAFGSNIGWSNYLQIQADSNALYPMAMYGSNEAFSNRVDLILLSNSLYPEIVDAAVFGSNQAYSNLLDIRANSNAVFPMAAYGSNQAGSNYELILSTSNALFPMATYASNLSYENYLSITANSNAVFPMAMYGSNLSTDNSNALFPMAEYGSNLSHSNEIQIIANSNAVFPMAAFGSNAVYLVNRNTRRHLGGYWGSREAPDACVADAIFNGIIKWDILDPLKSAPALPFAYLAARREAKRQLTINERTKIAGEVSIVCGSLIRHIGYNTGARAGYLKGMDVGFYTPDSVGEAVLIERCMAAGVKAGEKQGYDLGTDIGRVFGGMYGRLCGTCIATGEHGTAIKKIQDQIADFPDGVGFSNFVHNEFLRVDSNITTFSNDIYPKVETLTTDLADVSLIANSNFEQFAVFQNDLDTFSSNVALAAQDASAALFIGNLANGRAVFGSNVAIQTSNWVHVLSNDIYPQLPDPSVTVGEGGGGVATAVGFKTIASNLYTLCNAVGIGTSTPSCKLSVTGAVSAGALVLDTTGTLTYSGGVIGNYGDGEWASNAITPLSNATYAIVDGSDGRWASNAVVDIVDGSDGQWASNGLVATSNRAWSMVDGAFGSNLAVVTSNYTWILVDGAFGSNLAVANSNRSWNLVDGAYGSNLAVTSSNFAWGQSNLVWPKLIASSNQAFTVSGGGSAGNSLLAKVTYQPGSVTPKTSTAAMADVDATNLVVTFTAPTSGAVLIKLSAYALVNISAYGNTVLYWGLRAGTTLVTGSQQPVVEFAGNAASGSQTSGCRPFYNAYVSGLTSGASYTYKWGQLHTGSTAGNTVYGSTMGVAIMEVWSA